MDFEYNTYEAASAALDAAIADTLADNPEIGADDVAHDMAISIAHQSAPAVAVELCQRQLGWVPDELSAVRPDLLPE
jgi:hypothetical protein